MDSKNSESLKHLNQKSIVGIISLSIIAIIVIAMFIVEPPGVLPAGYFYFSLVAIICSLIFFGVCWYRSAEQGEFSLVTKLAFYYFLCQLIVGPIMLYVNGRFELYDPHFGHYWIDREWGVFLAIHIVVLLCFIIAYMVTMLRSRNKADEVNKSCDV